MNIRTRIERLEQRMPIDDNGLSHLSDDELVVMRLELCVAMLNHRLEQPERERVLAIAHDAKAEMDKWTAFWSRPDVLVRLPLHYVPPLVGNGCGEKPEHIEKRANLRARAHTALKEIERKAA